MKFKLVCTGTDDKTTGFDLYGPETGLCGCLVVLNTELVPFIARDWNGDIFWGGFLPLPIMPENKQPKNTT
jgi:hypothetical protein